MRQSLIFNIVSSLVLSNKSVDHFSLYRFLRECRQNHVPFHSSVIHVCLYFRDKPFGNFWFRTFQLWVVNLRLNGGTYSVAQRTCTCLFFCICIQIWLLITELYCSFCYPQIYYIWQPEDRQGAVYKIKFCYCQASYIGETGRNVGTWLTEHKWATRNGDINNHIAEHH